MKTTVCTALHRCNHCESNWMESVSEKKSSWGVFQDTLHSVVWFYQTDRRSLNWMHNSSCKTKTAHHHCSPISAMKHGCDWVRLWKCLEAENWNGSLPTGSTLCIPTVAGICGFMAGKISYMKTCQEKLKNLENSPLGEALRQRQHSQSVPPTSTPSVITWYCMQQNSEITLFTFFTMEYTLQLSSYLLYNCIRT